MDLPPPARGTGTHDRTGGSVSGCWRPEAARLEAGRARVAPCAVERLAVHPPHRNEPELRPPARENPFAQVHRLARATHPETRGAPLTPRREPTPNSPRQRVKTHLLRFIALHEQLTTTRVDEKWLSQIEWLDRIFPDIDYRYWA